MPERARRASGLPEIRKPVHKVYNLKGTILAEENHVQPFLTAYPHIAEWVMGVGWIEVGQDDYSRSLVRVLNEGGTVWESKGKYANIDEALQAADAAIATWFEQNDFDE